MPKQAAGKLRNVMATYSEAEDLVNVAATACPGKASREHSRSAVEGFHFQTGVVGEAVAAISVGDPSGFLQRVPFKRGSGLGNVVVAADVAERQHTVAAAEDVAHLMQFVLIVGCEND